jgi:ribosomal protein S12 methylthiotransferase accessory factor
MMSACHPQADRSLPYQGGTKRAVPPEVTFERIQKYLGGYGITRLADVTGLDCLGIPVFTSMRPRGRITQSSQGKGARRIDAKVSALMEAIETTHAENPTVELVHASMASLGRAGRAPVDPTTLCRFIAADSWAPSQKTLWVEAEELLARRPCLVPASSVYFVRPRLFHTSTNGLASGNDESEATLHALLEIYERDALSILVDNDDISFEACDVIDLSTIDEPILSDHVERLCRADVTLKLLRVSLDSTIHTFVALLLDSSPLAPSTHVSGGYGSHISPTIAASRAITEAAQCRIGNIQSAREFLTMDMFRHFHDQFFELAMRFEADTSWSSLRDFSSATIAEDLAMVVRQCRSDGATHIIRHTLTPPAHVVAVVKVQIPGARDDFPM